MHEGIMNPFGIEDAFLDEVDEEVGDDDFVNIEDPASDKDDFEAMEEAATTMKKAEELEALEEMPIVKKAKTPKPKKEKSNGICDNVPEAVMEGGRGFGRRAKRKAALKVEALVEESDDDENDAGPVFTENQEEDEDFVIDSLKLELEEAEEEEELEDEEEEEQGEEGDDEDGKMAVVEKGPKPEDEERKAFLIEKGISYRVSP